MRVSGFQASELLLCLLVSSWVMFDKQLHLSGLLSCHKNLNDNRRSLSGHLLGLRRCVPRTQDLPLLTENIYKYVAISKDTQRLTVWRMLS